MFPIVTAKGDALQNFHENVSYCNTSCRIDAFVLLWSRHVTLTYAERWYTAPWCLRYEMELNHFLYLHTQRLQIVIHENHYLFLELYDLRVLNIYVDTFTQKFIDMMPLWHRNRKVNSDEKIRQEIHQLLISPKFFITYFAKMFITPRPKKIRKSYFPKLI